ATGRKAFYTTPIKALSNQKYTDLVRRHGSSAVGLLTGDNTINGEAPVVVMTTEVLRNMLYAESATLSGLGYVVMDEVHYLADRDRATGSLDPAATGARVNPDLRRLAREEDRIDRMSRGRGGGRGGNGGRPGHGRGPRSGRRVPPRSDVIATLDQSGLLPAI